VSSAPRRGRRPGAPDTRAAILAAARARFAEHGFGRTSVRSIAADAGVDAALVHHYFGTKNDLFVAALELPVDPREVLGTVAAQGVDGAGERLVRAFLSVWDDPDLRLPLLGLARSVLDPSGQHLLRDGFVTAVLVPVGEALGVDRPAVRMPLVASQVIGLILMRYLFEVEPIASMPADDVVAVYGPTIQRYLADPLP
jgi:AcrR family transcriptional regulator